MILRINSRSINKGLEIIEMNLMGVMGGVSFFNSEMCWSREWGVLLVQRVSCKVKREIDLGGEYFYIEVDYIEVEFV